jgi:hypothetical protein
VADSWGRKLPNFPTHFIFGYGSLINSVSRNSTATTPIPAIPVRVSSEFGFRRCWNDRSPSGFTALGLCKAQPGEAGATINGVLYPVEGEDMSKFDLREEGYTRAEVPINLIESVGWQRLPERGRIWVYVPVKPGSEPGRGLPEPDASYPLLQSYIDTADHKTIADFPKDNGHTLPDCEVPLHRPSTLSQIVARRKRSYIWLTNPHPN